MTVRKHKEPSSELTCEMNVIIFCARDKNVMQSIPCTYEHSEQKSQNWLV